MNGDRSFGKCIPNDKLSQAMNSTFNVWFKRYKNAELDGNTFNQAFDEVYEEIMTQYDEYPLVQHICISFIYELDARMHGGYTETTRGKLLALIMQEGRTNGKT